MFQCDKKKLKTACIFFLQGIDLFGVLKLPRKIVNVYALYKTKKRNIVLWEIKYAKNKCVLKINFIGNSQWWYFIAVIFEVPLLQF